VDQEGAYVLSSCPHAPGGTLGYRERQRQLRFIILKINEEQAYILAVRILKAGMQTLRVYLLKCLRIAIRMMIRILRCECCALVKAKFRYAIQLASRSQTS